MTSGLYVAILMRLLTKVRSGEASGERIITWMLLNWQSHYVSCKTWASRDHNLRGLITEKAMNVLANG